MSEQQPDTRREALALLLGAVPTAIRSLEDAASQGNTQAHRELVSRGLEGGSAEPSGGKDKSKAQRRVMARAGSPRGS